jgi:hypothetical protein
MQIAKRQIVELLLARRDHQRAIRADEQLPEVVDLDVHSGLLEHLGIDPTLLPRDIATTSRRFDRPKPADRRTLAGRW